MSDVAERLWHGECSDQEAAEHIENLEGQLSVLDRYLQRILAHSFEGLSDAAQASGLKVGIPTAHHVPSMAESVVVQLANENRLLREAVEWVMADAAFKAPEQVAGVYETWMQRMKEAQ